MKMQMSYDEYRAMAELNGSLGYDDESWFIRRLYDPSLPPTRDDAWVKGLRGILGDERVDRGLAYVRETGRPVMIEIIPRSPPAPDPGTLPAPPPPQE